MRYRTGLIAYVVILNIGLLILVQLLSQDREAIDEISTLILNVAIIIVLVVGIRSVLKFAKPFSLLSSGAETVRSGDFSSTIRETKSEEFNTIIGVYNRMIVQLREERVSHTETNNLLTLLQEASPSGILIFDANSRLSKINSAGERLLDVTPNSLNGLTDQEISEQCNNIFEQSNSQDSYIFKPDGILSLKIQTGSFIDRGFETKFILIENLSSDIYTAEKRSFEKVIRMMSHEVNNSVSAVNSILETIHSRIDEESSECGSALQVCIDRNRNMNIFMKNFSDVVKLPIPKLIRVDLNEILRRVITLTRSKCSELNIDIEEKLTASPIYVEGDQILLEQVFMNIVKNSVEAIEECGEAKVDRVIEIGSSDNPAEVTISDSGVGILEECKTSLFTPFFSTKPMGQGVGLTLIKEILLGHNSSFSLRDCDNKTVFTVTFK